MILSLIDDDSGSNESDFLSIAGEDVDVYLNHYRIPKLHNYGPNRSVDQTRAGQTNREQVKFSTEGKIMSLTELAAQKVACYLPFGQVEHFNPPVPEPMQCRIAFWSFPQDEEDIRLYTCLANGNADVFIRAEELITLNCVCDMLQVGFHLSANVRFLSDDLDYFRVAITFDRRRITSCSCSCSASTFWCQHAVAVCLQRIRQPNDVTLRAPVSESLQRLEKNQLQKFAQYLINELPQQILPAAQKLLDELLSGDDAVINQNPAAPDPTAGATINEQTSWCLDDSHLSQDIRKILLKQCTAQPTVCSDIQALHTIAPPAATEYTQLLRPIRGREPEGLWNLISIVGEMMRRRDSNFFLLLEIMTSEVLDCDKIVTWWFETKVSLHSGSTIHYSCPRNNSQSTSQYSCSNFCDEIVHLWTLAAMNPSSSAAERKRLYKKFFEWHLSILKRHEGMDGGTNNGAKTNKQAHMELFPGFKPSMEGCLISWDDWDDKKGSFIPQSEMNDGGKAKSNCSKKKKKKSKNSKQSANQNQSSNTDQVSSELEKPADIQDENNPVDAANSQAELPELEQPEGSVVGSKSKNIGAEHPSEEPLRPLDSNVEEPVQQQPPAVEVVDQQIEQVLPGNLDLEQDLQVYYMEKPPEVSSKSECLEDLIKINARRLYDPLKILFSKAEGLHAHGHVEEAKKLALRAAHEILNHPNYPNLRRLHTLPKRRRKRGSLDNQMSIVASETLSTIAFLCNVLIEDIANHNLVFKLIIYGVEIRRSPAATKPLEVKLINQKHDLITLLKSVVLHDEEMGVLREKAHAFQEGVYENYSDSLTTLVLGNYLFEALVLSKQSSSGTIPRPPNYEAVRVPSSSSSFNQANQFQLEDHYLHANDLNQQPTNNHSNEQARQVCSPIVHGKMPSDVNLGFQAALSAISVKMSVSETDHPLLCEGARRQRGELALSMLTHFKDDQEKLDLILKHLLERNTPLTPDKTASPEKPTKKSSPSQDPNQPTEASAHFMFELAKSVFDKAGGNSLTAHLFRPQVINQNGARGIHRRLHMCSLRIALYALGLQNRTYTSSNWMHRTYNGRASFILEQALEIGLPAIKFLLDNWVGHLTPVEAACIADKAGCSNDPETKRVAAALAKSCLKYSNHLDVNAVRRILAQCKEQSIEMIEEACSEIEHVAESESVCADVLFATARAWSTLTLKSEPHGDINCCPYKDLTSEGDTGASDWLETSGQTLEKCPQFNDTVPRQMHWDVYGRVDFISNIYSPTYKHVECVKAAYRVGMKALDAMKPSLYMNSKHNPKKEDDVLWLLELSKQLGRDYLHNFSLSAIKNITNPHVLHHISSDLIHSKIFDTPPEDHVGRVNILLPLIHKCLDRFVKQTRDLVKHSSYEQKNHIDSILDVAQGLTETAYTSVAVNYFNDLLKVVDMRKPRKCRSYIDTRERHEWVKKLSSEMANCPCSLCRTTSVPMQNY